MALSWNEVERMTDYENAPIEAKKKAREVFFEGYLSQYLSGEQEEYFREVFVSYPEHKQSIFFSIDKELLGYALIVETVFLLLFLVISSKKLFGMAKLSVGKIFIVLQALIKKRKSEIFYLCCSFVLVSMLFFPPFVIETSRYVQSLGYGFIFSPPESSGGFRGRIDFLTLFIQCLIVVSAEAGVWMAFLRKR